MLQEGFHLKQLGYVYLQINMYDIIMYNLITYVCMYDLQTYGANIIWKYSLWKAEVKKHNCSKKTPSVGFK